MEQPSFALRSTEQDPRLGGRPSRQRSPAGPGLSRCPRPHAALPAPLSTAFPAGPSPSAYLWGPLSVRGEPCMAGALPAASQVPAGRPMALPRPLGPASPEEGASVHHEGGGMRRCPCAGVAWGLGRGASVRHTGGGDAQGGAQMSVRRWGTGVVCRCRCAGAAWGPGRRCPCAGAVWGLGRGGSVRHTVGGMCRAGHRCGAQVRRGPRGAEAVRLPRPELPTPASPQRPGPASHAQPRCRGARVGVLRWGAFLGPQIPPPAPQMQTLNEARPGASRAHGGGGLRGEDSGEPLPSR